MNLADDAIGTGITVEASVFTQRSRQAHFTNKKEIV